MPISPRQWLILWTLLVAVRPAAACTGDCDQSGAVGVNEAVRGVAIALGQMALSACPSFDDNDNGTVTVDELLRAVNAVLGGCPPSPSPTQSATPTVTPTPTQTPTATINQPPLARAPAIYRAYAGFEIAVPLATDPDGAPLACAVEALPAGASVAGAMLSWTPGDEQVGPFSLPFSCADAGTPPLTAESRLTIKVSPLDACTRPTCDPANGCTNALPPVTELCCADLPEQPRIAEPDAECPQGRVAFLGRNLTGFGRLQTCDVLHVRNFAQSSARITFHVETRCVSSLNDVDVLTRIQTKDRLAVNASAPVFIEEGPDGYARREDITFSVGGPRPYFDLEGAEANVEVTVTDSEGVAATERLRVRLSFIRPPDLPEAPTPPPTPPAP